jgi:regulatory protein
LKVTAIKSQLNDADRYSVFLDNRYSFSLSTNSLLKSGLHIGATLTAADVTRYQSIASEDMLYSQALRYVAVRPRAVAEIVSYLQKKDCPAPLIEQITNKLINAELLNDANYAAAYVHDRKLLRPTSRRKMIIELKKKHIEGDDLKAATSIDHDDEQVTIAEIIERKRRQTRYQDDQKLMQYLARQGFDYQDIKAALERQQTSD